MHQVEGEYLDYGKFNNKSKFYLNADKPFHYQRWAPPIHWKGFVGGVEVKFTQLNSSAHSENDFDWTGFPSNLSYVKRYIVEKIDEAMRIMD